MKRKEREVGSMANQALHSRGLWADAWHRFKKNKVAVAGMVFVLILVVISIATLVIDWVTAGGDLQQLCHQDQSAHEAGRAQPGAYFRH